MAVLTGADGRLMYGTKAVGKTRDWSISISKDGLETTELGDVDRTYVEGLRGTTGSATLLYDPGSTDANKLLDTIFETKGSVEEVSFVLNKSDGSVFKCNGFLTSVSPSVSVGAVSAVSISFQVSGKPVSGKFS